MIHVYKKISLEPFKSRIHGIIPSYNANGDTEDFYEGINSPISNWGMIPKKIVYNGECISYSDLIKRYHFCKRYNKLLTVEHDCRVIKYKDAKTYYKKEIINKNYELEMYYRGLDNEYADYGGDNFYYYCNDSLFPTFIVPIEITNNLDLIYSIWRKYSLSFIEVRQIIKKQEDFINTVFRCDKELGKQVIKTLEEWLVRNRENIVKCEDEYINLPISFTTSIENLGEFSIFSKDWVEGEDYRTFDETVNETNEYSGARVIYGDDIYRFTPNNINDIGSLFGTKYKENYFPIGEQLKEIDPYSYEWMEKNGSYNGNKIQWEKVDSYENEPTKESECNVKYANRTDRIQFNPTTRNMSYEYSIITNDDNGYFMINGDLYPILVKHPYIQVEKENKFYFVYDFIKNNTRIYYTVYDGVRILNKYDGEFFFSINGERCPIQFNDENKKEFISYLNEPIEVSDGEVSLFDTINNTQLIYDKVDGYVNVKCNRLLIYNNTVVTMNRKNNMYIPLETSASYVGKKINGDDELESNVNAYFIEDGKLYHHEPYILHDCNIVTGKTESKLSSLYDSTRVYDDMGNSLPGSLFKNDDGTLIAPSEGEFIDIQFHVGNISNTSKVDDDTVWGNIIDKIEYYYFDDIGNKVCVNDKIEDTIKEYSTYNENVYVLSQLMCDITYYMGAFIVKNGNEYVRKENGGGVKYIDTIKVNEDSFPFYKDEMTFFIVKYYRFEYETKFIENNEYDNSIVEINMSYFEYEKHCEPYEKQNLIYDNVFREEYRLGSSSKEKIEANIYIDRGISSAFEKHLKLLDCSSMESLEQTGNGYYNIRKS